MPHSKFFILHFLIFNFFYSRLLASSLSSLRSPFTRFTCAKIFWSFIRSIIYTRPLDWLSRYGWSICWISPVNTIFVPSPARVMMVFISFGVRFCASSRRIRRPAVPRAGRLADGRRHRSRETARETDHYDRLRLHPGRHAPRLRQRRLRHGPQHHGRGPRGRHALRHAAGHLRLPRALLFRREDRPLRTAPRT